MEHLNDGDDQGVMLWPIGFETKREEANYICSDEGNNARISLGAKDS